MSVATSPGWAATAEATWWIAPLLAAVAVVIELVRLVITRLTASEREPDPLRDVIGLVLFGAVVVIAATPVYLGYRAGLAPVACYVMWTTTVLILAGRMQDNRPGGESMRGRAARHR